MAEPFLGEIQIFGFGFNPKGWAFCNGQILPIAQNQALFSLLGTFYGGNGQTTFALPNMQSRAPTHQGQGAGGPSFTVGQQTGTETVTLTAAQLPAHTHSIAATTSAADSPNPAGAALAAASSKIYGTGTTTAMAAGAIANAGGNQPHTNLQPYLVLNFCIALVGIFPSRN